MKSYITESDIGAVLVGSEGCGFAIDNHWGDGPNVVEVYSKDEDFPEEYGQPEDCIFGKFNIYRYDCSERGAEDVVITLEGRYMIYSKYPKMAFKEF